MIPPASSATPNSTDNDLLAARILVVDDNPVNLEIFGDLLTDNGYHNHHLIHDSRMVADYLQAEEPDLVLLDIRMPYLTGFDILKIIAAQFPHSHIPVIVLTAQTERDTRMEALDLGASDFLTKPFDFMEILHRMRNALITRMLYKEQRLYSARLEAAVAERTRDLATANQRLKDIDSIKNDFLRMISHEMRTPANGLLAMSDLLLACCDVEEVGEVFAESCARLENLVNDATLLSRIEDELSCGRTRVALAELLHHAKVDLDRWTLEVGDGIQLENILLDANRQLLCRSLATFTALADCLAPQATRLRVTLGKCINCLQLSIDLENTQLPPSVREDFFKLESAARCESAAEKMGLAPVVAHRIFSALGGELYFASGEPATTALVATLRASHIGCYE